MSGSSYLDLVDVRGCSSGGSIPGRDEPSRGCDISVRILMVILGDLSRGNSKHTQLRHNRGESLAWAAAQL